MSKITPRISNIMDADETSLICPEAYKNVDSTNYIEPPGTKLVGIGIALIGLLVVCCIAYLYLFYSTSNSVDKALDTIIASQEAASPTDEPSQDIDN